MVETSLYISLSVAVSAITSTILLWLTWIGAVRYHRRHIDQSAIDLAVMVSLSVASLGLLASGLAVLIGDVNVGTTGRAISRIALLMIALLYVGHAWDRWRDTR